MSDESPPKGISDRGYEPGTPTRQDWEWFYAGKTCDGWCRRCWRDWLAQHAAKEPDQ